MFIIELVTIDHNYKATDVTFCFILRIKGLDPSLLELPAQALCCSLQMKGEISWSSEAKERFENIAADKCLNMSVVKVSDGKLLVKLKDEDGSLLNDVFDSSKNTDQGPSKVINHRRIFYA